MYDCGMLDEHDSIKQLSGRGSGVQNRNGPVGPFAKLDLCLIKCGKKPI